MILVKWRWILTTLNESGDKSRTFKASKPIYPYNIVCKAKQRNEVYIDPQGVVMPCCWLGIQIRKIHSEYYTSGDPTPRLLSGARAKYDKNYNMFVHDFYEMIEDEGGIEAFSLNHHTLEEILDNGFYTYSLEALWQEEEGGCTFCSNMCATNREKSDYHSSKIELIDETKL